MRHYGRTDGPAPHIVYRMLNTPLQASLSEHALCTACRMLQALRPLLAEPLLPPLQAPLTFAGITMSASEFLNKAFGYEYSFRWPCLAIICAYIVFFRLVAVWALNSMNFLKR
jgi:hypothetical protein